MIAIVKYNAGNIQSVLFALERLGVEAVWTDDPSVLQQAEKVIFPGVGEAASAMRYLKAKGLDEVLRHLTQPVLGICLGLQLFCRHSEENDTPCLGIFDVAVRKFDPTRFAAARLGNATAAALPTKSDTILKVPHMGWNTLHALRSPLFKDIDESAYAYFVHSYYAEASQEAIASCTYGDVFSAALQHNNFYAVQFHPEKSGRVGQKILENFINL